MSKINEQWKREADRRLKPPADFWSWCYSQITTYKWTNKDKTIIASDLNLGHCIEKRLTKSSRLTFYDKTYFFSIILSTSKRIEIQGIKMIVKFGSYKYLETSKNNGHILGILHDGLGFYVECINVADPDRISPFEPKTLKESYVIGNRFETPELLEDKE
ncbi:hypothetical protein [uncultured Streptococcus sp.]|uniref:hypothetical protein n=1 Tax=uncultured Streptococcus sp. TaxID=83427 RepID=UPI0028D24DE4|nr:hypothetical protein [uncultured Streptococcus sp.]